MGDGMVLESGTHGELLANEQGAYFRLVEAQKLRESSNVQSTEDDDDYSLPEKEEGENYHELAKEEVPLGRKKSSQSLASEILAQRQQQQSKHKGYSMVYLFKRMGMINRDNWRRYAIGTVGAISECHRFLFAVFCPKSYVQSTVPYILASVLYLVSRTGLYTDRKSTRLNSSHSGESRMPSSA